jgi:hypothetical protein
VRDLYVCIILGHLWLMLSIAVASCTCIYLAALNSTNTGHILCERCQRLELVSVSFMCGASTLCMHLLEQSVASVRRLSALYGCQGP